MAQIPEIAPYVNPARAGMILADSGVRRGYDGKPRASGDDPAAAAIADEWYR